MKKRRNFRKKPKDNSVGLSVKVYNNNVDGALRILKRKVKESKVLVEYKERQFYTKKSEVKRRKNIKAKLRFKKILAEMD